MTTTRQSAENALTDGERIASQTAIFTLHIRGPLFRRQISSKEFLKPTATNGDAELDASEQSADPALIHVSKDLIDRKELRDIEGESRRFKSWLDLRKLPLTAFLSDGLYLIPLSAAKAIDTEVEAFKRRRQILLDSFAERYPFYKDQAKARLGNQYAESDYPAIADILARFSVDTSIRAFSVPAALEGVDEEMFVRETEKLATERMEMAFELRDALRVGFAGLVARLAERLGTDETGKAKKFKDSTITAITDFLETFQSRNLTDDAQLAKLVGQARAILSGVKPDELRKTDSVRTSVANSFATMQRELDKMEVRVKSRKFALGSDVEI